MRAQELARETAVVRPPVVRWTIYDAKIDKLWDRLQPTARGARWWAEVVIHDSWPECYRAGLRVVKVELRVVS